LYVRSGLSVCLSVCLSAGAGSPAAPRPASLSVSASWTGCAALGGQSTFIIGLICIWRRPFSVHAVTATRNHPSSLASCLLYTHDASKRFHLYRTYRKQEAFEKCWAHSPLQAATLPFTRCRYCRTPPAHRCPRRLRRQQRQRQRVTEGTAMAP